MDPGLFFEFIAQLFRLSVVFCFFFFFCQHWIDSCLSSEDCPFGF